MTVELRVAPWRYGCDRGAAARDELAPRMGREVPPGPTGGSEGAHWSHGRDARATQEAEEIMQSQRAGSFLTMLSSDAGVSHFVMQVSAPSATSALSASSAPSAPGFTRDNAVRRSRDA